jgi:hypothetical protein
VQAWLVPATFVRRRPAFGVPGTPRQEVQTALAPGDLTFRAMRTRTVELAEFDRLGDRFDLRI